MKKIYLLVLFILTTGWLCAQNRTVNGTVKSETNEGLPGVNILAKGTTNGTITDVNGNFSISLSPDQTILIFSYVGYLDEELDVSDLSEVSVQLIPDLETLKEIVVIGYGTQKKVNLTGSVAVIDSEKLAKQSIFQTSQALQGLSPGLTAIQSSGQPGSDGATLRIRGIGSFSASSSPYILIDGVEGSLNGVDANDIESISVLKDAGAAAIYGNRGSNGVILITTKRGKKGKAKLRYNSHIGFQDPTNLPNPVGALDYLRLSGNDALLQQYLDNPNDKDNFPDTDFPDLLFSESGFQQYHQLSVSGGGEELRGALSLSYMDQDGNIPSFGFKRYNGRLNTDYKVSDKFEISLDLNFRKSIADSGPRGNGVASAFRQPSINPAIFSDGRFALPSTGGNLVALVRNSGTRVSEGDYFRGILKAVYKPIENLKVTALYSPENATSYSSTFLLRYPVYRNFSDTDPVFISGGTNNNTQLNQSNFRSFTDNFSAYANYSKQFEKHSIDVVVGTEFQKFSTNGFSASRFDFIIQDFEVLNNGNAENDSNSGSRNQNSTYSYFGRIGYNFNDKLLFDATFRRDGSSRFSPERRWGNFPSFAAAWRISEEEFLRSIGIITSLKLRASWGQLGNQELRDSNGNPVNFPYASLISIGSSHFANGAIQQGAVQGTLANPSISWETGETTNIGLDFGLFDNRLTGYLEYYNRKTNDLIGRQNLAEHTGFDPALGNLFSMKNTGIDLELAWRNQIGKLKYSISGNFSTVKNEVTDLDGKDFIINGNSINRVGDPAGSIYGYESIGIFQDQSEIDTSPSQFGTITPGDIRFKDQNDDDVINEEDRVIIGNPFPKTTYAINLGLDYKGFDFSVATQGVTGSEVLLAGDLVLPLFNAGNIHEWQAGTSWTPENPNAEFPVIKPYSGASNNARANSTYVFNTSYLRIRNITLGYTLPSSVLKAISVESVRIYASGQNLFTIDDMPEGIDPLVPNGSRGGFYPVVKSYTFGLNVTF